MGAPWSVLVVDDEEDVHTITTLALKRRSWMGRRISLVHARTGAEAREILAKPDTPRFHVALVDVAMETPDAGLLLCDHIRRRFPPTMRIILRTGQAGSAPEEKVLSTHDIDQYLAKSEVTEQRLFSAVRTSLRMSHDIAGVLAMARQQRALTLSLRDPRATKDSLRPAMAAMLKLLDERHLAKLRFVSAEGTITASPAAEAPGHAADHAALVAAAASGAPPLTLLDGTSFGLGSGRIVLLSAATGAPPTSRVGRASWFDDMPAPREDDAAGAGAAAESAARSVEGIIVTFDQEDAARDEPFLLDLELLTTNWMLARDIFRLRESFERG